MNELARRPLRPDPQRYFASLVADAHSLGYLSAAQAERIGTETAALLTKQARRYTHGASASVRVETAERLLSSAAYCIGHGLKALGGAEEALEAVCAVPVETLYARGRARLEQSVEQAREALRTAQEGMLRTGNRAYNDTLRHGLSLFFAGYDLDYGAHETPGSIDYPVAMPSLCGVEYMLEYVRRLDAENRFCRAAGFSDALLRGYHPGWRDMLENLALLTLGSALGAALLGRALPALPERGDAARLGQVLGGMPPERREGVCGMALERVIAQYGAEEEARAHLAALGRELLPALRQALRSGHPETVFLEPRRAETPRARYIDGARMEDEAFRALTEALRESRPVDKPAMIHGAVRSVADLADVLGADCLFGDEFEALFATLDADTLRLLRARAVRDGLHESAAEEEWRKRLARFLKGGH